MVLDQLNTRDFAFHPAPATPTRGVICHPSRHCKRPLSLSQLPSHPYPISQSLPSNCLWPSRPSHPKSRKPLGKRLASVRVKSDLTSFPNNFAVLCEHPCALLGDIHGTRHRANENKRLETCIFQMGKLSTVQEKPHTRGLEMNSRSLGSSALTPHVSVLRGGVQVPSRARGWVASPP